MEFKGARCYPNGMTSCGGVNFTRRPQAKFDSASSGAGLRAAWAHCMDKKSRIYPEAAAIG
jgi:hypothetical protein